MSTHGSAAPSPQAWLDVLDGVQGAGDVLAAASALARWPDALRTAPAATWAAIQRGEPPPQWWPLIRAVRLHDDDQLEPIEALLAVTDLDLGRDADQIDLGPLSRLTSLRRLALWAGTLTDLSFLVALAELEVLDIGGASLLTDIGCLRTNSALEVLRIDGAAQLRELSPLADLRRLHILQLPTIPSVSDVGPLGGLATLRSLSLGAAGRVTSIAALARLAELETLELDGNAVTDLSPLEPLRRLRRLEVRCASVDGIDVLSRLTELENVALRLGPGVRALPPLNSLHRLHTLLLDAVHLEDLRPLADLGALRTLSLERAEHLADVDFLATADHLRVLRISDAPRLRDVRGLGGLAELRSVALLNCPNLDDAAVAGLPGLIRG